MDTLMASAPRAVTRIIDSHLAMVGEGLNVRRALPDHDVRSVGPWVFLDHFGPQFT